MYTYQEGVPKEIDKIAQLYQRLEWDKVGLTSVELEQMFRGSWLVLSVYDGAKLIGTGRILSDGVITGLICGVGVDPDYQGEGVGGKIVNYLVDKLVDARIYPQLLCEAYLEDFYKTLGFETFTVGMNYPIQR
ncbi:GNAT family N-acetyltransferase [Vagococcus silagei]|uniref:GNAT family N-acetyltransferase n=1 Tax=Vagococcus silagei TaxID=2508885 RepID=A0A4S3B4E7_9ENTE|nr:GNAT family N-acetyltransferase [Vagococcus silagei]THB61137.1 GNAT family N-acetyltransferase [Vagococcus silagei]